MTSSFSSSNHIFLMALYKADPLRLWTFCRGLRYVPFRDSLIKVDNLAGTKSLTLDFTSLATTSPSLAWRLSVAPFSCSRVGSSLAPAATLPDHDSLSSLNTAFNAKISTSSLLNVEAVPNDESTSRKKFAWPLLDLSSAEPYSNANQLIFSCCLSSAKLGREWVTIIRLSEQSFRSRDQESTTVSWEKLSGRVCNNRRLIGITLRKICSPPAGDGKLLSTFQKFQALYSGVNIPLNFSVCRQDFLQGLWFYSSCYSLGCCYLRFWDFHSLKIKFIFHYCLCVKLNYSVHRCIWLITLLYRLGRNWPAN